MAQKPWYITGKGMKNKRKKEKKEEGRLKKDNSRGKGRILNH